MLFCLIVVEEIRAYSKPNKKKFAVENVTSVIMSYDDYVSPEIRNVIKYDIKLTLRPPLNSFIQNS